MKNIKLPNLEKLKKIKKNLIIISFIIFVFLCSLFIFHKSKIFIIQTKKNYTLIKQKFSENFGKAKEKIVDLVDTKPKQLAMPEKVKGIYMTGYTFLNKDKRNYLINLVTTTELNSIVIDIQDPSGRFTFEPTNELLKQIDKSDNFLSQENYSQILQELQEKGIYTIARIVTFQDNRTANQFPDLALKKIDGGNWRNWTGLSWLDMTNPEAWRVPILKAHEAEALGFDEIQFDYIRFPSDGNVKTIIYNNFPAEKNKTEILKNFYEYLSTKLEDLKIPTSIDLFGFTYNKWANEDYDLGIGQKLIDAAPYFDVICPMVYPSHYPSGHLGFANPALHPYEVINNAMQDGKYLLTNSASTTQQIINIKTRPWLQDFDIGANYTPELIRKEIQAVDDNYESGWVLWNALNKYTEKALIPNK